MASLGMAGLYLPCPSAPDRVDLWEPQRVARFELCRANSPQIGTDLDHHALLRVADPHFRLLPTRDAADQESAKFRRTDPAAGSCTQSVAWLWMPVMWPDL